MGTVELPIPCDVCGKTRDLSEMRGTPTLRCPDCFARFLLLREEPGKHRRADLKPVCGPDLHFGPTAMRSGLSDNDAYWFCANCDAVTGVAHMTRRTDTGVLLAAVPNA